jgi:cytoplasmic iron level regulating protein YaaA (DUF328/UPF0246 family)
MQRTVVVICSAALLLQYHYRVAAFEMKFLCLLSPTKALAEKSCKELTKSSSLPAPIAALSRPRSILIQRAQELKKAELKSLMKLSDNLAELNHQRYQNFNEQLQYQAGWLFDGPSFQKLNINDLSKTELDRLDSSLCILSGLYGFLRPSDPMQPYRLEMGTRLSIDGGGAKNLYEFWNQHELTKQVATLASSETTKRCILNCASQEYSKVLNFDELRNEGLQVLDIVFQASNGGRMASVYAKQARGMFVRFVAKANPSTLEELQQFTGDGHYAFASQTDDKMIFERHATAQGEGDESLWNGGESKASTKKKTAKGAAKKTEKKSPSSKRAAEKDSKSTSTSTKRPRRSTRTSR